MSVSGKCRALFLDRDGVINEETNYLYRCEDVRWVDGITSLCRTAQRFGYKLVVVTNQAGIGRGYYTEQNFHDLMDWMRMELGQQGVTLDAVYFCPYHPQGIPPYNQDHEDRKPNPGMLLRAAQDHGLDLTRSILVGDRCTDIGAANAAALEHAFLLRGTEPSPCVEDAIAVDSLAEVEAWLLAHAGLNR